MRRLGLKLGMAVKLLAPRPLLLDELQQAERARAAIRRTRPSR